jgi:hypothetical protein
LILLIAAHFNVRRLAAKSVMPWLRKRLAGQDLSGNVEAAFLRNTRAWRTVLTGTPSGWSSWARSKVARVLSDCENYVQTLNQRFTSPYAVNGKPAATPAKTPGDS